MNNKARKKQGKSALIIAESIVDQANQKLAQIGFWAVLTKKGEPNQGEPNNESSDHS